MSTQPGEDVPALEVVFKGLEIEPGQRVAPAGDLRVVVLNEAALPHDFLVLRTDLPAERLPVEDGRVVEGALDVVGRVGEVQTGEAGEALVHLAPGRYLLLCNEPGHYERAVGLELTVQPVEG